MGDRGRDERRGDPSSCFSANEWNLSLARTLARASRRLPPFFAGNSGDTPHPPAFTRNKTNNSARSPLAPFGGEGQGVRGTSECRNRKPEIRSGRAYCPFRILTSCF